MNRVKFTVMCFLMVYSSIWGLPSAYASDNPQQGLKTPDPAGLAFTENVGQVKDQFGKDRKDIDFRLATPGLVMFVGKGQIHYQWWQPAGTTAGTESEAIKGYRMDVELVGANPAAEKRVELKSAYYENHFGAGMAAAGARAYSYQKVTYRDIYPGIDWVLYTRNGQVEYDFVVHPGGDPRNIRMRYLGASSLRLDEKGALLAETPMGTLNERAPYSFQQDGKEIASRFVIEGNELRFQTGQYEGILTIDPVLSWGSYFYGESMYSEMLLAATSDPYGNVYWGGTTVSNTNIATLGSFQSMLSGIRNHFLVKFDHKGQRLWGTYYGNSPLDNQPIGIVCDTMGHVYLASITDSMANVTTAGAYQEKLGGGSRDYFLAKFDSSGARIWGTFYGGNANEGNVWTSAHMLASDGRNVYLCAGTQSTSGIASAGSHQPAFGGGTHDAFLVKFNDSGVRQWATYYGGTGYEMNQAVAVDAEGNVYIAGSTTSADAIATAGSYQPNKTTGGVSGDGFLAKFDANGVRQWATYFGGTMSESLWGLACDGDTNVYITGTTQSTTNIATAGSFQPAYADKGDAFIAQFNSKGERQWSTYYGGPDKDEFRNVVVDRWNKIYLGGGTASATGIASPGAYKEQYGGKLAGGSYGDGFFAAFNTKGERLWGSYYGGTEDDLILDISINREGALYIAGTTKSRDLATPGSFLDSIFQPYTTRLLFRGFMAKFCAELPAGVISIQGVDTLCANSTAQYITGALLDAEEYNWILPEGWEGSSDSNRIQITTGSESGWVQIQIKRCGQLVDSAAFPVYVVPPAPATISIEKFTLSTSTEYASYQWLLNGELIPGADERAYEVTENGDYAVITTNDNGCIDTSDAYKVRNWVSVANVSLSEAIRIFPNPASGALIYIKSPVPVSVGLYGIDGRLVRHQAAAKEIPTGDIAPGVYMIRVSDSEGRLLKAEKWSKW